MVCHPPLQPIAIHLRQAYVDGERIDAKEQITELGSP